MVIVLLYKDKLDEHLILGGFSMKGLIAQCKKWLKSKTKSHHYTEKLIGEKEVLNHMEIVKETTIDSIRTRV